MERVEVERGFLGALRFLGWLLFFCIAGLTLILKGSSDAETIFLLSGYGVSILVTLVYYLFRGRLIKYVPPVESLKAVKPYRLGALLAAAFCLLMLWFWVQSK